MNDKSSKSNKKSILIFNIIFALLVGWILQFLLTTANLIYSEIPALGFWQCVVIVISLRILFKVILALESKD